MSIDRDRGLILWEPNSRAGRGSKGDSEGTIFGTCAHGR